MQFNTLDIEEYEYDYERGFTIFTVTIADDRDYLFLGDPALFPTTAETQSHLWSTSNGPLHGRHTELAGEDGDLRLTVCEYSDDGCVNESSQTLTGGYTEYLVQILGLLGDHRQAEEASQTDGPSLAPPVFPPPPAGLQMDVRLSRD